MLINQLLFLINILCIYLVSICISEELRMVAKVLENIELSVLFNSLLLKTFVNLGNGLFSNLYNRRCLNRQLFSFIGFFLAKNVIHVPLNLLCFKIGTFAVWVLILANQSQS